MTSRAADDKATGAGVGPYKFVRTLGLGSFSKVKLAIHEPTKKKVAIKILNRQKLRKMDMAQKIWREIEIQRALNHPHVVRLYETIDTPEDL
jgi:serine/threonine protein kinase